MIQKHRLLVLLATIILLAIACQAATGIQGPTPTETIPASTRTPAPTPTSLPAIPVQPGDSNPNEPVFVTGEIPYTSRFFLNTLSEPFVLLEDQAGFVRRDREFEFGLEEQVIGPVVVHDDDRITYSLTLPLVPLGTMVDVDNDGEEDKGVQIYAIAYWSNTWGGPFLEERDGTGWSTAYASTVTDPENKDEIIGGVLIVWSPDDDQSFPTGFGDDGLLFTEDDPTESIPAGYNIVDLNSEPFQFSKDSRPEITLNEGAVAVNDFSGMSYEDAFNALFEKVSIEYPFTVEKTIDWDALYGEFAPRVSAVRRDVDFYRVLRDFTYQIPDDHVFVSFNAEVFFEEQSGGFGMTLAELDDGRVVVSNVLPNLPAENAGIQRGAEILEWDNQPVEDAIQNVTPYFGPFSAPHTFHINQVSFLPRVPPGTRVAVTFRNPGEAREREAALRAEVDYDSLFLSLPGFDEDELALPVSGEVLDDSGLGYLRIPTFSDDYNLMAQIWERFIEGLVEFEVQGLIIDVRGNSGGSGGMALAFAGYFFEEEIELYHTAYFSEILGEFEFYEIPAKIKPAPLYFPGPVAVLVGPNCVSACEGFAYAMQTDNRSIIVGHTSTAGAYGEVGRGQYKLPGEIEMQFPTGRTETLSGELVIEGVGVQPGILVPVTEAVVLDREDAVLQAAVEAILEEID